ncbi:MAG TPA: D-sedoheptulose 7-phosphate isomerase [Acidobacteriaceae bacterium]|jgi:D-sedoheptulose 7-phosphate isomerase
MLDIVRRQLQQSLDTLSKVLGDESIHKSLLEAARVTAEAMHNGRKLLVCGNGGSAADAQHLVAELVVRLTVDRPALRAIALTTDSSIFTAIGNDYGFEHLFARQVEALGVEGDVLLAISTSGNSPNCLRVLERARELGLTTIAFTGNGGGKMAALADINVIVPCMVTMNIQESQLALEHILCMLIERCYFGPDFGQ